MSKSEHLSGILWTFISRKGIVRSKRNCEAFRFGSARRAEARKCPEASACQAYYGHLSAEKMQACSKGIAKRSSLDLSVEQKLENVQKRAPVRHIMDIYQLKRCRHIQKELRSALRWTCQLCKGQKMSRSEHLSGVLWTFISGKDAAMSKRNCKAFRIGPAS